MRLLNQQTFIGILAIGSVAEVAAHAYGYGGLRRDLIGGVDGLLTGLAATPAVASSSSSSAAKTSVSAAVSSSDGAVSATTTAASSVTSAAAAVTPSSAPTSSTASTSEPSKAAPALGLPSLGLPSLAGPTLGLPSLGLPSLAAPTLALPTLAAPSLGLPSVGLPSLAAPSLALPSLSAPSILAPLLNPSVSGAKTTTTKADTQTKATKPAAALAAPSTTSSGTPDEASKGASSVAQPTDSTSTPLAKAVPSAASKDKSAAAKSLAGSDSSTTLATDTSTSSAPAPTALADTEGGVSTTVTRIATGTPSASSSAASNFDAGIVHAQASTSGTHLSQKTIIMVSVASASGAIVILGLVVYFLHKQMRPDSSEAKSEFGGFSEWDGDDLKRDSGSIRTTRSIKSVFRINRFKRAESPPPSPGFGPGPQASGGLQNVGMGSFGTQWNVRQSLAPQEMDAEQTRREDGVMGSSGNGQVGRRESKAAFKFFPHGMGPDQV